MSTSGPIPVDQLRELPTAELALMLLKHLSNSSDQMHLNSVLRGADQGYLRGEVDRVALLGRLSDAWAWLEAKGLIGHHPVHTTSITQTLTREGREMADDDSAMTRLYASERLAGPFDPVLASALHNFHYGDYETACFAAMKQVEVAVREAAGFDNSLIGVPLMRRAFARDGGPLSDDQAEPGERVATMELFAGSIGAFKNPSSHRTVDFADPVEAAEIIQLADLLLRMVRRAESQPYAGS
jgi:uncharacterized protein (TIGR02391 family)